jgi:hypothetical protein
MLASVDWTAVLVLGIPGYIAAAGGVIAAVKSTQNRRNLHTGNGESIGALVQQTRDRTEDLKTPSGDPIGAVAERAEHLSSADVALTKQIHAKVTNGAPPPPGAGGV